MIRTISAAAESLSHTTDYRVSSRDRCFVSFPFAMIMNRKTRTVPGGVSGKNSTPSPHPCAALVSNGLDGPCRSYFVLGPDSSPRHLRLHPEQRSRCKNRDLANSAAYSPNLRQNYCSFPPLVRSEKCGHQLVALQTDN
jgi:hypothetical protein